METFLGQRGLASDNGVSALRNPQYSPACTPVAEKLTSSLKFVDTYSKTQAAFSFTWNKYPLE